MKLVKLSISAVATGMLAYLIYSSLTRADSLSSPLPQNKIQIIRISPTK